MASYLSKPTEYAPYQPTVNAELYGKLLMKKEAEYQAGVEKVNKNLDYVASLPVASEREKKYLQDKINTITSQLNSNVNTDWSDQSIQQLTTSHIKDITNDDNIKTAIYNASVAKRSFGNLKKDTENTDGKNVINQMAFMDQFNNWEQNGKLGEKLNVDYMNYQDIIGDFDKWYKEKKPDSHIKTIEAGYKYDKNGNVLRDNTGNPIYDSKKAMFQWSAVDMKYTEITPDEVEKDFAAFIKSNPNYQKQLEMNAKYTYKNLTAEQLVNQENQVLSSTLKFQEDNLERAETIYGKMSLKEQQSKKGIELLNYINTTKGEVIPRFKYNLSPEQKLKRLQNWSEDNIQTRRNELYTDDLYKTVIGKYAFHKDEEIKRIGDPFDKINKQRNYYLAVERQNFQEKKWADQKGILEMKAKMAQAKSTQGKNALLEGAMEEGVSNIPGSTGSEYQQFRSMKASYDNSFNENMMDLLYYQYGQNPNYKDKFAFDSENKPVIAGKTKEEQQRNIKIMTDIFNSKYNQYKKNNVSGLSKIELKYFAIAKQNEQLSQAMGNKLTQVDQEWEKEKPNLIKNTKSYSEFINLAKNYRGPYTIDQIKNIADAKMAIQTATPKMTDAEQTDILSNKIAKNYGFKDYKDFQYQSAEIMGNINDPTNSMRKLHDAYASAVLSAGTDEKNKFYDNYVRSNIYSGSTMFIPWRDAKHVSQETIKELATPYLRGKKSELLNKKGVSAIGYEQDEKGEFYIVIKGSKGEKDESYHINQDDAQRLGFTNIRNKDYLSSLLQYNSDRSGKISNTWGLGPHDYTTAMPLMVKNEDTGIRYHISRFNNDYVIEFWNQYGPIIDKKTGKHLEAVTNSLDDAKAKIENFSATGDPNSIPKEYYASAYSSGDFLDDREEENVNEDNDSN